MMRRKAILCLAFALAFCSFTVADEPAGKLVEDVWYAAYLGKTKAGYSHVTVRETDHEGKKTYRAVMDLRLSIRRNQGVIELRSQSGGDETQDGKVLRVMMRHYQGDQLQLSLSGEVQGDQLEVRYSGAVDMTKKIPWNTKVIGPYKQSRLFLDRKAKPGDSFTFLSYEPTLNAVLTSRVNVVDYEEIGAARGRKRLLKVETVPEAIQTQNGPFQAPGLVSWLDREFQVERSQFDMPVLGTLTLIRTSRAEAVRPAGNLPDILSESLIALNREIPDANRTHSAVYRITVKGEKKPETTFSRDDRQEIKNIEGGSFELHVHAEGTPSPAPAGKPKVDESYRASNHWINSDDPTVRAHTRRAVRDEIDPWQKALKIESWVHKNMTVSFGEGFARADQVAQTLRGDCRQHAFLTAAMCRVAGIPSRTALGLVYTHDRRKGPVMAFHMWTEVWIDGRWRSLDATRGEGRVGAAHLKIADHGWHNEQSLAPVLPVYRVMGKLQIEVLSVDDAN